MSYFRRPPPPDRPNPVLPRLRPTPYPSRTLAPSFLPRPRPARPPTPPLPAELIALIIDEIDIRWIDPETGWWGEVGMGVKRQKQRLATLAACARVSRAFLGPAIAALYRDIDLVFRPREHKYPTTQETAVKFWLECAHPFVKMLDTPHLASLVREVHVDVASEAGITHHEDILKRLVEIFSIFRSLDHVDLTLLDANSGDTQAALDSLLAVSPHLSSLDILLPDETNHEEVSQSLWNALRHTTELRRLLLDAGETQLVDPEQPFDFHLTSLRLYAFYESKLASQILASSHTSLRRLTILATMDLPDLTQFRQLTDLTWEGSLSSDCELLAQLPNLSTLEYLHISRSGFHRSFPSSSFLSYLPSSESLKIAFLPAMPPTDIIALLESDKVPLVETLTIGGSRKRGGWTPDEFDESWTPWTIQALAGPCARRSLEWWDPYEGDSSSGESEDENE